MGRMLCLLCLLAQVLLLSAVAERPGRGRLFDRAAVAGGFQSETRQSDLTIARGKFSTSIPFELIDNRIFIDILILRDLV